MVSCNLWESLIFIVFFLLNSDMPYIVQTFPEGFQ